MNQNELPLCTGHHHHEDSLSRLPLPPREVLQQLAAFYRVFGDATRLGILTALEAGELCVCDLASHLSMTVSAVSHQLRLLKQARLVKFRRDGKTVFYSLDDDHIRSILAMGQEHVKE